jgi:nicotinate-nucleotide adenylyltransferase
MKKRQIGLFFGSFNPIHNGHLMLANYIVEYTDLDSIWFVVSPQNPFKDKDSLLDDNHRLEMLKMAIQNDERFEVCDIEFDMPKPSYTIDTLNRLSELHPDTEFYLICGMDNLNKFKSGKTIKIFSTTITFWSIREKTTTEANYQIINRCKSSMLLRLRFLLLS